MSGNGRSTRLAAAALFIFVTAIYLQTFGAVFQSIDEDIYLRMTRSLVEGEGFAITPVEYAPAFSVARGLDGQMYANRPPGFPIVAAPFYLLGKALASLDGGLAAPPLSGDPSVFEFSLTLANMPIVAVTVVLLFLTLVRLGYGRPASAAVALLLAFGTMLWSYASKSFFAEPLLALCGLAAFYLALRHRQGASRWTLLAAGAFLGWGVLTKVTALALVPWLALYVIWPVPGRPLRLRPALARLAWLAAGIVPFAVALMTYNYTRFGSPLTTGYELESGAMSLTTDGPAPFLLGLFGLLLSPGKGLALYATPILLGLWAAPRFWRAHPPEALFVLGAGLTTLTGVAMWRDWSGGWCWGPRLVLDAVPLLLVPAASLFSPSVALGRGQRRAIVGVTALSVAIQLLGVLPSYLEWYMTVGDYNLVYFSPLHSPIVGHWLAVAGGRIDLFWNKTDFVLPGYAPLLAAARWVLLVVAIAAGWMMWRLTRADLGGSIAGGTTETAPAAPLQPGNEGGNG